METRICKKCGRDMVLRKNRKTKRKFYGCSGYPKCDGVENIKQNYVKIERPDSVKLKFELTPQQKAIHEAFASYNGNIAVNATAGSAKTTTSASGTEYFDRNLSIAFISFARDIANSNMEKTPKHVHCSTFNSLGGQNIKAQFPDSEMVEDRKLEMILDDLISTFKNVGTEIKDMKDNKHTMKNVIEHLQNYMLDPTEENIDWVMNKHHLVFDAETPSNEKLFYKAISFGLKRSFKTEGIYDFGDQIYWCARGKVICKKFDIIIVDEAQDTNKAQREMIKRSLKVGGRVIVVGDKFQSIMSFRGADTKAMELLTEEFKCKQFPLSVSFRCSKAIGRAINREFPHIEFSVMENAVEGSEEWISKSEMTQLVKSGDMVLCRNNAPLVKPCFELIKNGIKAIIKGRNIGDELMGLIDYLLRKSHGQVKTLPQLINSLDGYRSTQTLRLAQKKNMAGAIEAMNDKVDTIFAIMETTESISELSQTIDRLFTDNPYEAIVFSSIHKSKGLEADNIFIIREELIPSPMAITEDEMQQEENIKFIAYSRGKINLYHVTEDIL